LKEKQKSPLTFFVLLLFTIVGNSLLASKIFLSSYLLFFFVFFTLLLSCHGLSSPASQRLRSELTKQFFRIKKPSTTDLPETGFGAAFGYVLSRSSSSSETSLLISEFEVARYGSFGLP
jgi:hypothetical protein